MGSSFTVTGTEVGGGGTGTVTAITSGVGITMSPDPTTTTGSPNLDIPVTVAHGGTEFVSTTAYGVICGGTTSTGPLQNAGAGVAGQAFISNGPAALGSFQAVPLQPGAWSLIGTRTASGSASVAFVDFVNAIYSSYVLIVTGLQVATGSVPLLLRVSNNSGATYATVNYESTVFITGPSTLTVIGDSSVGSSISMTGNLGNSGSQWFSGTYNITTMSSNGIMQFGGRGVQTELGGSILMHDMSGGISLASMNSIQLRMSIGNISAGTFKLYGIAA